MASNCNLSDDEDPVIRVKELAKVLSSDRRLRDNWASLPTYLGIRSEDVGYLSKRGKTQPDEAIHATLEYYISLNGNKATVKAICTVLAKKHYVHLSQKLQEYKHHRLVGDNDPDFCDMEQEIGQNNSSGDVDEILFAKMSAMDVEDEDEEGYGTKDTIVIEGMKDENNPARDMANVQLMLDRHNCLLEVVDSLRFQGKNKQIRSLKVKMKARKGEKSKRPFKSLMNKAIQNLQSSKILSRFSLTVSEFNPQGETSAKKERSIASKFLRVGGTFFNMTCHYLAEKFDR